MTATPSAIAEAARRATDLAESAMLSAAGRPRTHYQVLIGPSMQMHVLIGSSRTAEELSMCVQVTAETFSNSTKD
jgi:hypothetical protein